MIPVQTQRSVETSPTVASASFGISQNDVAHILTMLRDTLYSDRVLAVLREYAANAWDVHRAQASRGLRRQPARHVDRHAASSERAQSCVECGAQRAEG